MKLAIQGTDFATCVAASCGVLIADGAEVVQLGERFKHWGCASADERAAQSQHDAESWWSTIHHLKPDPNGPLAQIAGTQFDPADPWAHRSRKMRCATCMWFVPKGEKSLGRCRRHAPTLSGWPAVFDTDWCGDHKLDEEKA